jgi:short chain dehydrogenase
MELADRAALVTGGGRGIGESVARKLASLGADVVVSARTASEIEAVAADVRASGGRAHAIAVDVGNRSGCETLFREAVERMGRVDILVNNAGVTHFAPVDVETDEGWHHVMAVNLHSAFYLTRATLPAMRERRWGRDHQRGIHFVCEGDARGTGIYSLEARIARVDPLGSDRCCSVQRDRERRVSLVRRHGHGSRDRRRGGGPTGRAHGHRLEAPGGLQPAGSHDHDGRGRRVSSLPLYERGPTHHRPSPGGSQWLLHVLIDGGA